MNIIQDSSLSFDQIRTDLENYIKSLPDYETKWKDFYEAGAGETVLNTGAGITAFLAYAAYMNRRDSLLDFGNMTSTIVSIGSALGYVYNRKSAPLLQITFTSTEQVYWDKEDPIGNYMGRSMVLANSTQIEVGVNTIVVAIGDWVSQEITITDAKDFKGINVPIQPDNNLVNLYIDGEKISYTTAAEDMDSDNVLIRSYFSGIFIIFGNGSLGRKAAVNQVLKIEYVAPADKLDGLTLDPTKIQLYVENTSYSSEVKYPGSDPDSPEKIVAIAPGYYSAKRRLVTLDDYASIGASYQGVVSANAALPTTSCCSVNVSYLRADELTMNDAMKADFEKYMLQYAMLGSNINVIDPIRIMVDVKMRVVIDSGADTDAITKKIRETINKKCMTNGAFFTVNDMTLPESLRVRRIYIKQPILDRQAKYNEYYKLRKLEISYTEDRTLVDSGGTDKNAGYEYG